MDPSGRMIGLDELVRSFTPGTYLIEVRVTDAAGRTRTLRATVEVIAGPRPTMPATDAGHLPGAPAPTPGGSLPLALIVAFLVALGFFLVKPRRGPALRRPS